MKKIAIVGSTGSIGTQTLEVIKKLDNFRVVAMSCGHNFSLFERQLHEFSPEYAAMFEPNRELEINFPSVKFFYGAEGIEEMLEIAKPDYTVLAASGAIGLRYSLKAIEHSRRLCLANKESIVCGGELLLEKAKRYSVEIIPVDSEHSALFQLLQGDVQPEKIFITASGGALRDYPLDRINEVTLKDVLNHPVWSMGVRITIDSATMVNKGLEVIEAHYLFSYDEKDILTYVCKNSVIHAGVIYSDGTIKLHVGKPDMRIPIAYSLTYPQRAVLKDFEASPLDYSLFLEEIDYRRYPALKLAREITGIPSKQIAFNAADEIAVKNFVEGRISFGSIYRIIEKTIERIEPISPKDFEEVQTIDVLARKIAQEEVRKCSR